MIMNKSTIILSATINRITEQHSNGGAE